jgi:hypothetical protein
VTNTGGAAAREVAQVYVSRHGRGNPAGSAPRVDLAAFAKTRTLAAGPAGGWQTLAVTLPARAFAVVATTAGAGGWMWTGGTARVWVGGRAPTLGEVNNNGAAGAGAPPQALLYAEVQLVGPDTRCAGFHEYTAPAHVPPPHD